MCRRDSQWVSQPANCRHSASYLGLSVCQQVFADLAAGAMCLFVWPYQQAASL